MYALTPHFSRAAPPCAPPAGPAPSISRDPSGRRARQELGPPPLFPPLFPPHLVTHADTQHTSHTSLQPAASSWHHPCAPPSFPQPPARPPLARARASTAPVTLVPLPLIPSQPTMDSSSRSHKPLSVNTTPSTSSSSALPSTPQRNRSLGKKTSQAQLRGLFGRLRNKGSSCDLDFGCSGPIDEDFGPVPRSAPASSAMGRQGSGAGSFRGVPAGGGEGQSRRSSNADSVNSVSRPSPPSC